MHVFPGLNYYNTYFYDEQFWYANYTERFITIMQRFQSDIIFGNGAHIHRAEFRDSVSSTHHNFSLPFLVTPSVSPVYMNNPGYTTLSIKDNKIFDDPKVSSL